MTNLELLKIYEQDLLDRQMMCHHQQNSLRGSGPIGSVGSLTPDMAKSSFESSKYSHGGRDSGKT